MGAILLLSASSRRFDRKLFGSRSYSLYFINVEFVRDKPDLMIHVDLFGAQRDSTSRKRIQRDRISVLVIT